MAAGNADIVKALNNIAALTKRQAASVDALNKTLVEINKTMIEFNANFAKYADEAFEDDFS